MIKENWYSPAAIKFRRPQVIFVLQSLPTICLGIWPPNPRGSGYVDAPMGKGTKYIRGAGFETIRIVIAEITARVEMAGFDGILLEAVYTWGKSHEALAKAHNLEVGDITVRVNRALKYCSGWSRKRRSYEEYRDHRRGL